MDCRIFATDIHSGALSNAKKGIFNISNLKKTTIERVDKEFHPA